MKIMHERIKKKTKLELRVLCTPTIISVDKKDHRTH
jgi:hypothetical protein